MDRPRADLGPDLAAPNITPLGQEDWRALLSRPLPLALLSCFLPFLPYFWSVLFLLSSFFP